jgi:hypothetical protein
MASSFEIVLEFFFGLFVLRLKDYGQYIGKAFNKCLILAFVSQTGQNPTEALRMIMDAGKESETHLLADNMLLDADLFRRIRWPILWLEFMIVVIKLDSQNTAVKEVALYYNLDPESQNDFSDMKIIFIYYNANHFQAAEMKNDKYMNIKDLLIALEILHEAISDPMDLFFTHYNCANKDIMPVLEKENTQISGIDLRSDYDSFKESVANAAKVIDFSDKSELISIFSSLLNPFSSIFSTKEKVREIKFGDTKSK